MLNEKHKVYLEMLADGDRLISLLKDAAFKKMIATCTLFVKSVLKEFLPLPKGAKIFSVNIENPELISKNFENNKTYQMDVRGTFTMTVDDQVYTQHPFNIEMQQQLHKNFIQRIIVYLCDAFSHQLNLGASYSQMNDAYSLIFLAKSLPKNPSRSGYVHSYSLINHNNLADWISSSICITVVELNKMTKSFNELEILRENLCFFIAKTDTIDKEMALVLMNQGGVMEAAIKTSFEMSVNEDLQRIIKVMDDFDKNQEKIQKDFMEQGLKQGLKQGTEQGIVQGLKQGIEQGIVQGLKQGIEQGIEQGMQKGITQRQNQIARSLLLEGMSHAKVSQLTDVNIKDVKQIAQDLKISKN